MELLKYWRILRKRLWLLIVMALVGSASAIFYTAQQPPIYRSTTTLLLSPASGQGSLLPGTATEATSQLAQTYNHYLKTQMFAELVIAREGLTLSAAEFVNSVSTSMIEGTQFFEITAVSNEPGKAQQLASAIADNFIQENLAQQRQEIAARRAAGDVDNIQTVLVEKLERERQYYEEEINLLRASIKNMQNQPATASHDESLAQVQTQLSEYEERLVQIMSDQIKLQPPVNEQQLNAVTVVEPAALPTAPVNNQGLRNILFAFVASLLLGTALAVGLDFLDYTIKSPEELEELLGQSALGVLGLIKPGTNRRNSMSAGAEQVAKELILLTDPRAPVAESVRALRTNLRFSGAGRQLHSLVVTSAGPGEGKSTVAANLALAFASAGQRVILIDGDLRRPSVHQKFKISKTFGLSNLLIADNPTDPAVIAQHLQPGPVESLRILACGPLPPNPAELLSAEWALPIYAAIEAEADLVIWDSPPILTVTDAAILAARADATIQVIKAGTTRRDMVMKTREVLQRVGANVLAPVLNQVQERDIGYYQYYYYRYGKDGRPYGMEEPKRSGEATAPPPTYDQAQPLKEPVVNGSYTLIETNTPTQRTNSHHRLLTE